MTRRDRRLSAEFRGKLLTGKQDDYQALYRKLGIVTEAHSSLRPRRRRMPALASLLVFVFSTAVCAGSYFSLDQSSDDTLSEEKLPAFVLGHPLILYLSAFLAVLSFVLFLTEVRKNKRSDRD